MRKKEQKRLLPVEYVIAAILVLVIVAGVWMAMRGRGNVWKERIPVSIW